MKLKNLFLEALAEPKLPKEETCITMDMPLFIRALEFAREDALTDIDLHVFAENAEELMKKRKMLGMKEYKRLLKGVKTKKEKKEK